MGKHPNSWWIYWDIFTSSLCPLSITVSYTSSTVCWALGWERKKGLSHLVPPSIPVRKMSLLPEFCRCRPASQRDEGTCPKPHKLESSRATIRIRAASSEPCSRPGGCPAIGSRVSRTPGWSSLAPGELPSGLSVAEAILKLPRVTEQ